ncbi:hypothetical protein BCR43DRAFT_130481 [Syncephalastrum racemosum]|uniref:F-box domain-containing protein n=1 Tax=Syncephalastrum racemosum TaxID=13706 RepID=A0A1X2HL62_SYNRA|nr:hypothetical protein BCR43DRAFT_130481 [Syncephalastrum racemosum]
MLAAARWISRLNTETHQRHDPGYICPIAIPSTNASGCILDRLPVEVARLVFDRLDSLTLCQLTQVCSASRQLLIQYLCLWRNITVHPSSFSNRHLRRLVGFLVAHDLNINVQQVSLDRTPVDPSTLQLLIRFCPNLTSLSLKHCPRLDCWQILLSLKTAHKQRRLQHLTSLRIQGAFPSERSHTSYAHEMYCYGEIKKILLHPSSQLSESHYALYQFWRTLRPRMQPQENSPPGPFRDRMPETPANSTHTEEDKISCVRLDVSLCRLCHKHVGSKSTQACLRCTAPTSRTCAQCACQSCQSVLCAPCFRADPLPVLRCSGCHLIRRQCLACRPRLCSLSGADWRCPSCSAQPKRKRRGWKRWSLKKPLGAPSTGLDHLMWGS